MERELLKEKLIRFVKGAEVGFDQAEELIGKFMSDPKNMYKHFLDGVANVRNRTAEGRKDVE